MHIMVKKEGLPMASKYAGYMGKVVMVDLTTETVSEYPWTDKQRELYLGGKIKIGRAHV